MKSTNNSDNHKEEVKQGNNTGSNKINEYQNKLSSIKQRYNQKNPKAETTTNKEGQGNQNLYSSFSAMNSSLSKKWDQIQKSSATKRDGGNGGNTGTHMSNTMGGGFGVENRIFTRKNLFFSICYKDRKIILKIFLISS